MTSTRRLLGALALVLLLPTAQPLAASGAVEAEVREAVRGADGIGDPYFPLDGNGGIDVAHYRIHDVYRFGDRTCAAGPGSRCWPPRTSRPSTSTSSSPSTG